MHFYLFVDLFSEKLCATFWRWRWKHRQESTSMPNMSSLSCREIVSFLQLNFAWSCLMSFLEHGITVACVFSAAKVTLMSIISWVCSPKYVCERVQSSAEAFAVWMIYRRSLKYMFHKDRSLWNISLNLENGWIASIHGNQRLLSLR